MKKILISLMVFALVLPVFITTTPTANAACSSNGYYNSNGSCSSSYSYSFSNGSNTNYSRSNSYNNLEIEAYIQQILALLQQLQSLQDSQNNWNWYDSTDGRSDVDVVTRSPRDVSDEDATLRGEVDFNKEDEATVFFQYGKSSRNLYSQTTHTVLDEDDDEESFSHSITNLRDETTYYYRAVAEDENGDQTYGNIISFKTDDDDGRNNDDDEPDVDTDNATRITDRSARLHGEVDMNDFRNGLVFFVYGEDEDQVEDIEDDYNEYRDIDEDGDDLQKIRVDTDLDNQSTYYASINGFDDNTDIYFSICVEYEDEDDDETIKCGKVGGFETEN